MHLGIIGYGSIARALIARLPADTVSRITVLVRTPHTDQVHAPDHTQFVTTCDAVLAAGPDMVVECAGHGAVSAYAVQVLDCGIDLIVASVGALAEDALYDRIQGAAATSGAKMILPTGAIGGLDLLSVLAADGPVDVTYTGTKPPAAWKGSPAEAAIKLDDITDRCVFFTGTGREAAIAYPKNANVVAALALAGAGFDQMTVSLVADPQAKANVHAYRVSSPACRYEIAIENVATPGNAKTSLTTVLSIRAEVLKCAAEIKRIAKAKV